MVIFPGLPGFLVLLPPFASPRRCLFSCRFSRLLFSDFWWLLVPFSVPFVAPFSDFSITFSSMKFAEFFHRFRDRFGKHFWCLWEPFSVQARNLQTFPKPLFLQHIYMFLFTLWKNIMFDTFDDLSHYLLWHWFFDAFGHRFGVLFRQQNQCFGVIVFWMLCCLSFL